MTEIAKETLNLRHQEQFGAASLILVAAHWSEWA
jgi:hypothetical protein